MVPHCLCYQMQHNHLQHQPKLKVVTVQMPPLFPGESKATKDLLVALLFSYQTFLFIIHRANTGWSGGGTQAARRRLYVGFLQMQWHNKRVEVNMHCRTNAVSVCATLFEG